MTIIRKLCHSQNSCPGRVTTKTVHITLFKDSKANDSHSMSHYIQVLASHTYWLQLKLFLLSVYNENHTSICVTFSTELSLCHISTELSCATCKTELY